MNGEIWVCREKSGDFGAHGVATQAHMVCDGTHFACKTTKNEK